MDRQEHGVPQGGMPAPNPEFLRRMKFYEDTVALRPTDGVFTAPFPIYLPINLYGMTTSQEVMMDYMKILPSLIKYQEEFQPDLYWGPQAIFPGAPLEGLDCQFIRWPGKHLPKDSSFQVVDREEGYMSPDEYLEYAEDPTGFIIRKVLPRHYAALKPLEMVDLGNAVWQGGLYSMIPFGLPHVQGALHAMMEAGEKMLGVNQANMAIGQKMMELGWPGAIDYAATAPFDLFNDTLRGFLNTTMDMIEYPDELLAALETSTRQQVKTIRAQFAMNPFLKTVCFFIHNGMDMFMSLEQYKTFYWPGLKACIEAVIELGGIAHVYLEDKYDDKLDLFANELPAGNWIFTLINCDLEKAKEKFAGRICIGGGVDGTLLQYGTREQVVDNVKHAIDILAPGGGYFLNCDVSLDVAKSENLHALFDTARNYRKF